MILTTPFEAASIAKAGQVVGQILKKLQAEVRPGMTGKQLDAMARKIIAQNDCQPNFLHYQGFPAAICVSRNAEIIHGIPNDEPFAPGDLISIDVGCQFQGFHADAALSVAIPPVAPITAKILKSTKACLTNVINQIKPGMEMKTIGKIVEQTTRQNGFFLAHEYSGHGIGRSLHEEPNIFNTEADYPAESQKLVPGMVFCVEPMLLCDDSATEVAADGFTVRSRNQKITCHFEHTIKMTEKGAQVLTEYEK